MIGTGNEINLDLSNLNKDRFDFSMIIVSFLSISNILIERQILTLLWLLDNWLYIASS